ncbi:PBP1A family penicillin-binding protein [cyanobacterium endosymbiont of Epithemia clementina EcSB]|uniref:PBP1A family penicillin-binding protein n=1 Tax=cyanobacterium endosymbiont of Epithemia clementina EcSB TaxID=3034674 RepID=UPI002480346A|nr:PBP1A family penicillin-binding protein [cyanobacterium endosymbiont of Epithemia clementina EcSB]WGT67924.1 PBP1A family penicillin-binding protein [cyanobacterium endosymbiont of Epithemia clementina EcSB]
MFSKPPSFPKHPLSQLVTQVVEKLGKGKLSPEILKKGKKVPELHIQDKEGNKPQVYSLIGDRYILGRSSRFCDILIANSFVSQVHCSLRRDKNDSQYFVLEDEHSTNGIYHNRQRIKNLSLRHGDVIILGPPELAKTAKLTYHSPPPVWRRLISYTLYGTVGLFALVSFVIIWESRKYDVTPLPSGVSGPVVVYARDDKISLNPITKSTHQEVNRLQDFSPYLSKALIASEDTRFYWHFGVDPYGIVRALVINSKNQGVYQGASTLTQQLARSLFTEVGWEDTASRKLREMIVALKLEAVYSKNEILKTYLNKVYLGGSLYGFEDAARFYFDKSARDLTISEAATLVAMLPAPNLYNPVQDYDTSVQLRNRVITRMADLGMIKPERADRERRSRIKISPKARKTLSNLIAPYLYSHVFKELRTLLGNELAKEGNFIVETGLDLNLQSKAEKELRNHIKTVGSTYKFSQGAIVTLDTSTGEILALVGGVDYKQSQFNRVTQAKRQPGSIFKVFGYAAAIEQGVSPRKVYSCDRLRWMGQQYKPCERSGRDVDMYRGMAQSENAIALRVAQDVGLNRVIEMAQRLGVGSALTRSPGLILGQSEVTVLEMAGAYATFANQGVWNRPHAIQRILDGGDCSDVNNWQTCRVIYDLNQDQTNKKRVISYQLAQTMTDLLRGVVQRGTGRSASIGLGEAGKTGTTNKGVDLWFVGYVPSHNLVTGVWLGNDDNSPTRGSSSQAAALWRDYMKEVLVSR